MSLQIFCRLRPPISPAFSYNNSTITTKGLNFNFDWVFNESSSQKEIFHIAVEPLITDMLNGQSGCIMLFGPSEY